MSSSKRHFTAVVNSKEHGLYISSSPSSAARKIVSKLCASSKSKKVEFCVREITQGSKKKTYGPYLGEMKKLAKPIELKGRVIRYTPEVHLKKKKKTAIKTVIKLGKKMRGGTITDGGELSHPDFIIKKEKLHIIHNVEYEEQNSYLYGQEHPHATHKYKIVNYDHIQPCELIRKKDRLQEPFIFFGKKIYGEIVEGSKNEYLNEPIVYREYVAFNKGLTRFNKTAKFKKLYISNGFSYRSGVNEDHYHYHYPDFEISEIPIDALEQLRDFIIQQRTLEHPTFCKTIYKAVIDELDTRKYFPRQINRFLQTERQIELIGRNDRNKYRNILGEIKRVEKLIFENRKNDLNGNYQRIYQIELRDLLKEKKIIESRHAIVK